MLCIYLRSRLRIGSWFVEVRLVNGLIHNVKTENILMYAGAFVIAKRLGMIKDRKGGKRRAKIRRSHIGRDGSMGISRGGGKI